MPVTYSYTISIIDLSGNSCIFRMRPNIVFSKIHQAVCERTPSSSSSDGYITNTGDLISFDMFHMTAQDLNIDGKSLTMIKK